MTTSLSELFSISRIPPNRRILALHQVRERAAARSLGAIVTSADAAIAHDEHALSLETSRIEQRSGKIVDSTALDDRIDRAMRMISHLLDDYCKDTDKDVSAKAHELRDTLLPLGLAHHISLPYQEQHVANETVVAALEAPENREWVENQGLRPLVNRLRNLNASFGALLHASSESSEIASWSEVQNARKQGHELFLEVVARIVGTYAGADDAEARTELLQPILEQVRAASKKRRATTQGD